MAATSKPPGAIAHSLSPNPSAEAGAERFILTLCQLHAPTRVPQPQDPRLKPYRLFMSRSRRTTGDDQLLLHMGYFTALAEAQECLRLMRATYPNARINRLPPPRIPTVQPPTADSLTDTQVFQILEKRSTASVHENRIGNDISLLRPDDTNTRRVLKQAVADNTPVSFATQLLWSVQPIDLVEVPSVEIFRAYTLYVAEGHREGRRWYSLRLGFFKDAISARQVAHYVRSKFPAVAVVPITEQERAHGEDHRIAESALRAHDARSETQPSVDTPTARETSPPQPRCRAGEAAQSRDTCTAAYKPHLVLTSSAIAFARKELRDGA